MNWIVGIVLIIVAGYVCSWMSERNPSITIRERQDDMESCALCRLSDGAVFAAFETIAKPNRDLDRLDKQVAGLYLIPGESQ